MAVVPTPPAAVFKALKRPLLWALLGLGLLGLGRVAERRTVVDVYSSGGHVEVNVAGSRLSAPVAVTAVQAVEIFAMDSADPPGGRLLEVTEEGRTVVHDALPRRFRIPGRGLPPLGDWQLDEHAARGLVYRRAVDLHGVFDLHAVFTGRFHHELEIVLVGTPTVGVALRRGLINNDLAIRVGSDEPLAVTSIDPAPWSDLLSAAGLLVTAASAAAFLIALSVFASRALSNTTLATVELRRPRRAVLAATAAGAAVFAVAVSAWCAGSILEGLPHMPDSVTYLLQSRWLLAGHLTQKAGPLQPYLDLPFTYVVGGRWLAQYPFAWPALLALGTAVGLPWLVAPLLAGLYVWLLYLIGRELFSPGIGALAALLAAMSPLGRLLFSSMFPHAAAATLILLAAWLLLAMRRLPGLGVPLAAGLAAGLAFGVRPLPALAVLLPVVAFVLSDGPGRVTGRHRLTALVAAAAGAVLAVLPTLLANRAVTGNPLHFAYSLAHGTMFGLVNIPFGLRNMDALLASTPSALFGWGWGQPLGRALVVLSLALPMVPFLLGRSRRADWVLATCFGILVLSHLGARANGLHGFGPRYYFEGFFALGLLAARGFVELGRLGAASSGRRRAAALLATALFIGLSGPALAILPARLALYRGYNHVDGSLVRHVHAMGLERALILFAHPNWYNWAEAAPLMGSGTDGPLVFASRRGSSAALLGRYSDRPVYLWDGRDLSLVHDPSRRAPGRTAVTDPAPPRPPPGRRAGPSPLR